MRSEAVSAWVWCCRSRSQFLIKGFLQQGDADGLALGVYQGDGERQIGFATDSERPDVRGRRGQSRCRGSPPGVGQGVRERCVGRRGPGRGQQGPAGEDGDGTPRNDVQGVEHGLVEGIPNAYHPQNIRPGRERHRDHMIKRALHVPDVQGFLAVQGVLHRRGAGECLAQTLVPAGYGQDRTLLVGNKEYITLDAGLEALDGTQNGGGVVRSPPHSAARIRGSECGSGRASSGSGAAAAPQTGDACAANRPAGAAGHCGPLTNAEYALFVATGHRAPLVTEAEWQAYGLLHPYTTVGRFLWHHGHPPPGRLQHPVVLVSHADAMAYCTWRGQYAGRPLRLPSEAEWEKAARGTDGRYFPWGNIFDARRLNSADGGPYDTVPVGQYPQGQSPHGVLDMAGQVFEWTATPAQFAPPRFIVKGWAWDDLPGVTRAAARHARPAALKHILIGFRCATSEAE